MNSYSIYYKVVPIILIAMILLSSTGVDAESSGHWLRTVSSSGDDEVAGICLYNSYLYLAGSINGQVLVAKVGVDDSVSWVKSFGGSGDIGYTVVCDSSGYVYVAGKTFSQSLDITHTDAFIAKVDPSGANIVWYTKISSSSSSDDDAIYDMVYGDDGYLYVTGYVEDQDLQGDILIAKIDPSSGNVLWWRVYGGTVEDWGDGIYYHSGYIYITGYTESFDIAGLSDVFILQVDPSNGDIVNKLVFGTSTYDEGLAIYVDDVGIYLAGYTGYTISNPGVIMVASVLLTPQQKWVETLDSGWAYGISVAGNGKLYVSGYTSSYGAGGDDIFITEIDPSDGRIYSFMTIGGSGDDYGYSHTIGSYVYIVGKTATFVETAGDVNAFAMLWSPSISDTLTWEAGSPYSENVAVNSYTVTPTDISGSILIGSPIVDEPGASLTVTGVSGLSLSDPTYSSYLATDSIPPVPVPEPWFIALAVLIAIAIFFIYYSRGRWRS